MSLEKIGNALGRTFQQVHEYERGRTPIGCSQLQQLAGLLGVPVSFFFEAKATAAMPAIHEFANSAEVRRLAKAFLRISWPAVRHRIAALVRELATIRRDLMLNSPEAEEFFDLARYGLMLAEQMADDATRESLLKLVRAWVAAERQATQLAGRDECAS